MYLSWLFFIIALVNNGNIHIRPKAEVGYGRRRRRSWFAKRAGVYPSFIISLITIIDCWRVVNSPEALVNGFPTTEMRPTRCARRSAHPQSRGCRSRLSLIIHVCFSYPTLHSLVSVSCWMILMFEQIILQTRF